MSTVVIVGHGRSPVGKGWGAKIDSCDLVVRMWNWHWMDLLDWGERYDYGLYEIHPTEMARFYKHNCRTPMLSWVGTRSRHHKLYDGPLPKPTYDVDPRRWEFLGYELGGMGTKGRLGLSRGALAASWLLERLNPGDRALLVGFDNCRAGIGLSPEEGFPVAYRACPATLAFRNYKGGTRQFGNHDYGVEYPLLAHIAQEHEVELAFAEDVWK